MPTFTVSGHGDDGVPCEIVVDGESAYEIEKKAHTLGFRPSNIRQLSDVESSSEERLEAVSKKVRELTRSIKKGRRFFMYRTDRISIDSEVENNRVSEAPDLYNLQRLGLSSWEVVGTVPQTSGFTLQNVQLTGIIPTGTSNAGGIGGNVTGAYVCEKRFY